MRTFLNQQTISIERQTWTANKSTTTVIATGVKAYIRPLEEKESTENDFQYGEEHFVLVEVEDSVDIRRGDNIIFDGKTHGVEGVGRHNRGISLPDFKQVLTRLGR